MSILSTTHARARREQAAPVQSPITPSGRCTGFWRSHSVWLHPTVQGFHRYGDHVFGTKSEEHRFSDNADWPIPDNVDIIITHSPPKAIRDTCVHDGKEVHILAVQLFPEQRLEVKPKLHCFGHIHEGYGCDNTKRWQGPQEVRDSPELEQVMKCNYIDATQAEYSQKSLYINAAIQGRGGLFSNAPFIVDLPLSTQDSLQTNES